MTGCTEDRRPKDGSLGILLIADRGNSDERSGKKYCGIYAPWKYLIYFIDYFL
jgi:hypothetical protein